MAIEIRQINPHFVAEIGGIDLSKSVGGPTVDAIWEAIDRYAVLVFRDQQLDDTQLRDFNFGPLEIGRAAAALGPSRDRRHLESRRGRTAAPA
jgi:alpha-ketoglutarate-dependent 2,4-dichlorophenoxyacetate dioxygenase